tara:strand:+ start:457 stop:744 length:288 start_codon:yes stop_codon:yes gene_type:complete
MISTESPAERRLRKVVTAEEVALNRTRTTVPELDPCVWVTLVCGNVFPPIEYELVAETIVVADSKAPVFGYVWLVSTLKRISTYAVAMRSGVCGY